MTKEQATVAAMRLFLDGNSEADILEWLSTELKKNQKPSSIVAEAKARFAAVATTSSNVQLGYCQELARELIRLMLSVGDYAGARMALTEYAKLTNSYTTAKKLPADNPSDPVEDDELSNILEIVRNG